MTQAVLVSSGEASGDRMAAMALASLGGEVRACGMGGQASAAAGLVEVVPRTIQGIMGMGHVARHWRDVLAAHRELCTWARQHRPRAALLVGFTTFHERLGRALRDLGVPVVWCAAPQVWAWRRSRLRTLRAAADHLAVILPFEEALWRNAGHDAWYVGHPAMELCQWNPAPSRRLAVLCGSRDQEALAVAPALVRAARAWLDAHAGWTADVLVAASLGDEVGDRVSVCAREAGLAIVRSPALAGAAPVLGDYDVALCVSGTVSLEAAISGTPPVVVYRATPLVRAAARAVLRVPDIALPNVLLGRRAFPEIVDERLDTGELVEAMEAVVCEPRRWSTACEEVRERLELGDGLRFGDRVARLVLDASG